MLVLYRRKDLMRPVILAISVLIMMTAAGCLFEMDLTIPQANGQPITAKVKRWGNQSLEGLILTGPGGWVFGLEKQKSEFEAGFDVGAASVKVGGGK